MNIKYGFHATLTAHAGRGDELLALLLGATRSSGPATSESCLLYLVGRSAGDPDIVHVTEGWTTRQAHDENLASAEAQVFLARVLPLLAVPGEYRDEVPVGGILRAGVTP